MRLYSCVIFFAIACLSIRAFPNEGDALKKSLSALDKDKQEHDIAAESTVLNELDEDDDDDDDDDDDIFDEDDNSAIVDRYFPRHRPYRHDEDEEESLSEKGSDHDKKRKMKFKKTTFICFQKRHKPNRMRRPPHRPGNRENKAFEK